MKPIYNTAIEIDRSKKMPKMRNSSKFITISLFRPFYVLPCPTSCRMRIYIYMPSQYTENIYSQCDKLRSSFFAIRLYGPAANVHGLLVSLRIILYLAISRCVHRFFFSIAAAVWWSLWDYLFLHLVWWCLHAGIVLRQQTTKTGFWSAQSAKQTLYWNARYSMRSTRSLRAPKQFIYIYWTPRTPPRIMCVCVLGN